MSTDHLTGLEKGLIQERLMIPLCDIHGPVSGILVTDQPVVDTILFPFPKNNAGERLLRMSAMTEAAYLGRLKRTSLFLTKQKKWHPELAKVAALNLHNELVKSGPQRVILIDQYVARAFGITSYWTLGNEVQGICYIAIPHPQGPAYDTERPRIATRAAMQWAADLLAAPMETP